MHTIMISDDDAHNFFPSFKEIEQHHISALPPLVFVAQCLDDCTIGETTELHHQERITKEAQSVY